MSRETYRADRGSDGAAGQMSRRTALSISLALCLAFGLAAPPRLLGGD
jgi:hypothetical protein